MLQTIFGLLISTAIPVALSVILYLIEKKTAFSKIKYNNRQLIIGIIFGLAAIYGTELGVPIEGVTANVRDAAPLCAGLIFGSPAGIIAGIIGGAERWIATAWGAGEFSRVACSLATVLAGFFAAWLRKYMFSDKKPSFGYGLAIGLVTEVLHMLLLFLTNMDNTSKAFKIVQACAVPMIILNGIAVMLSVMFVTFIGKERGERRAGSRNISQMVQGSLLICVLVASVATITFTVIVQTGLSRDNAKNLMKLNIDDVTGQISDASDENIVELTRVVKQELQKSGDYSTEALLAIADKYDVAEVDIVDANGIISSCTDPSFVGFDMASGEQSAEFMCLLDGTTTEFVQSYQPISYDSSLSRKYAGITLDDGGFIQVGYDADQFQRDISEQVKGATVNRHVGKDGCIIICDENWNIVSDRNNFTGQNLDVTGIWIDTEKMPQNEIFAAEVYGEQALCMYIVSEGYYIVGVFPESEVLFTRDVSVYITTFMEIIVFAVLFVLIYFLIRKLVVDNIRKINVSLAQIASGDLNVKVDVRTNEEFSWLSDDINSTVVTLKRYISEAAARIDKELEFAKSIQLSALPSVFPPYPSRTDFDIYAQMDTAKEVGGDFYDFYMLDNDNLAFLIADVSGKGIPAAMFMMTSKTMIKSHAETGAAVNDVFTEANEKLCETNEAGMFVTAWMGVINLKTGLVTFANAGHNPPLVRHKDGSFEYLKSRAGFVLAGMENVKYRKNELQLEAGDEIYLYTDGVTEATDKNEQLYGEERLLTILNARKYETAEMVCKAVKADVDRFVGDAPQFDDITMLSLKYKGGTQNEGTEM